MSYNPKPLDTGANPPGPPTTQAPKGPPTAPQLPNNLHVLSAAGGLAQLARQQQLVSFQSQALLYQQQQIQQAVSSSSAEPLALTRGVADKQANGNVTVQAVNPTAAHQMLHTTSLKLTYQHKTTTPQMQHKPPSAVPQTHKPATTTPAHMASQPTSVQHHTASVATATQAQVQHTPVGQQPQPVASQQKVPSPQKAAPPPQTRAPVAVASSTAAQSQLQANNNVPKAPSPQQVPPAPPKASPSQAPKLATVVTPSKTTMKLATVTTPRIKQTARKNQAALTRPQSNFAAAAEAAAATKAPTKAPPEPKAVVPKEAPAPVVEKVKEAPPPKEQPVKKEKPPAKAPKPHVDDTDGPSGIKRNRTRTVPYQSPLPEFDLLSKLSYAESGSSGSKNSDDKLVLFYKNEFMAVRNSEGGFFLCQTQQNVYKSSPRIRIQWLSEEKPNGQMYIPDFYDITDLECVLTSVELKKKAKKLYELPTKELERIRNILKKAIDVEKGILPRPDVTEENPDGLDLSLYKDESQLEKGSGKKRRASGTPKGTKRTKVDDEAPKRVSSRTKLSPRKNFAESDLEESDFEDELPIKKPTPAPRGRPAAKAPPVTPKTGQQIKKSLAAIKPLAKSKVTPAKTPVLEVVVPKETKARGRKRKIEPIDPLALPLAKKAAPETPAAAAAKGNAAKKSATTPQSTKKPLLGKAKKPDVAQEAPKKPITPAKISPKAKVTGKKEAASGRMTRGRK